MQRNGVVPGVLYDVQFSRQVRAGRRKKAPGVFSSGHHAEPGIDEYIAHPIYDVWFLGADYKDWYTGYDTGTALTVDGFAVEWTTEQKLMRKSETWNGETVFPVEQVYVGLREPTGPNSGGYGQWSVPARPVSRPKPLKRAPKPYGGMVSNDWIAEIAEFHLGTGRPPPFAIGF
ncbi:hypothetical protein CH278_12830 [Rhodococcus sp. 05-2254-5]|uniref:hypothetical protein n=1 Tax=unclassified Rhodococcus (in: high G+C Gram-positive bacteria) TaxID=192944 RepID=UPI000B9B6200|nr:MULTISPECIES: hypothetical protein [unclassified Rhodococcus (in: high G+C Gram-positive bacteria)]OZE33507.1 hypothetical protein CH278_12830 [Rhodococcus sp. 05-2254-5]OZE51025.1 hypothetical protein CH269_25775 [Rhodococcus sp. 05-2254-1]